MGGFLAGSLPEVVRVDAGFGEALIGALAGGGIAVARHGATRLVRGCLDRFAGTGPGR